MMPLPLKMIPQQARDISADPRFHEFLWYCVPGVLVGLALRLGLMISMPFGFYHPDTHDFLTTADTLVAHHHFVVHGKTTFLTPVLYTLAFFPKVPALFTIPLAQHARGLLLILMTGALARLWFDYWRWLIVPLTVLMAMQPAMLFWEHTLMSESGFVFGAVALALAGTCFMRWPDRLTYGFLLGAMACVAAARPEGNLWQGAGILWVALVYWGHWRREWRRIAGAVGLAVVMLAITKTSHSGLLLYSSLVHLTPDNPRTIPDFGPYIQPLRDEMIVRRNESVSDDVVKTSKKITAILLAYVKDHPHAKLGLKINKKRYERLRREGRAGSESEVELRYGNNSSNLCRRLAMESASAHPWSLPGYAWRKFRAPIQRDAGGVFEDYIFHQKQASTLLGNKEIIQTLGPALSGTTLETPEQATAFVWQHYDLDKVEWYNRLEHRWQAAVNSVHLPDTRYSEKYTLPGLPIYHLLGMLGALVALFRPGVTRRFHWGFVPVIFGAWFIVMLTAAVIPRHRFVWEPFWLLYGFGLFDSVIAFTHALIRRGRLDASATAPPLSPATS